MSRLFRLFTDEDGFKYNMEISTGGKFPVERYTKVPLAFGKPCCPCDHPRTPLLAVEGEEGIAQCPESGIYFKYTMKIKKLKLINGEMKEVEEKV